jgi:hypothetical protein
MKQTEFNAMPTVETVADALLLADGTNFLFNETQVRDSKHGGSPRPSEKIGSQSTTALRHKIHYYRRDINSTAGYVQVFDILESDILTQETRTVKRIGKDKKHYQDGPVGNRDDDAASDIISDTNWVI